MALLSLGLPLVLVLALVPIAATAPTAAAAPADRLAAAPPPAPPTNVNTSTALVATPASSAFGQSVTFTATVTPVPPATGTPTGSVTFVVDGVQTSTQSLVGGSASFSTSVLGAGGHTVTATYSGDATFNQSSATISYNVACGTTITGNHVGTIVVTGAVCLNNAQVTGGITVQAGGSVDVENSTLTGSINASNSGAIRVCSSTIGGSVSVTGATGPVMIGDPTDGGCGSNTIKGSLSLENNTGGVEALGNKVTGALIQFGNSPPVEISSHAPPVAVNDNYSVVENQSLTVPPPGVLANDSAPSGGTLTASLVAGPSHAAAFTLNPDGSFSYTPAPDFSGIDTFTYRNNDGVAFSDPATVIIKVIPQASITVVKSEPTPGAGVTVTAGQAAPITYNLAVTNSGGTGSAQVVVTDAVPAGTTYVAGSATCGATANCSVNFAGSTVTWTLTSVAATTTGTLSFQVTVNAGDANGSTISNQANFTNIKTPGCGNAATCATNTVTNPVVTPASVTVVKSEPTPGAGTTVTAGQAAPVSYQLAVANSGGTASGTVTVTDVIPAGTTYVAGSASCGATPNCSVAFAPTTVTWTLTSVAPLSTNNLTFQVTVNAGDANNSTISNQASFTNVMTPSCGSATCTTNLVSNPVITPASIAVTKSEPTPGAGTTVIAGQAAPITYNLAVTNSGGTASGAVTVTDAIPAGTTYVGGSASCGATPNCSVAFAPTTVTWTLTSVAALSTGNLTFQVTVNAGDANGSTISNQGSFTDVNTPGCANAATCSTNTVTNPVLSVPAITVTKSEPTPGAGVTVTAGQAAPITYNLAVTNSGGTASGAVTVTDAIPAGTTYVAGSASCGATPNCSVSFAPTTVTWTLTSVAPLSTGNLSFQVTVNAGDANGSTISNQGSFTDVNTPGCANAATCATNTVSNPVVTAASIAVVKSEPTPGAGTTVTAGQAAPITYNLAVTNSGGTASGTVTVTDAIPVGTTYVAGSASCGATPNCSVSFAPTTVTWTLTSVAPLSTNSLSFQVTVNAGDANGSTISNQGSFTDVNTPGCANAATCATNTVSNPVVTPASIAVVKSEPTPGAGVTVTAGQAAPVTYNLAVTNSGGTASGTVTVTDVIPAGTTYVAGSASCGVTPNCTASFAPTTVTWTLTSVAPLSTNTLSFQVTVNAGDANGSTISNTASFTDVNTPGCANAATCMTNTVSNPVVTPASISVVKSEPTPGAGVTVTAGQAAPITYNLTVANSGGTPSGAVTVTDAIPAGTTYVAGSASCGATPNCSAGFAPTTVTWTLTSVAPLSTNTLSFQVTVNANDVNGSTISNTASFTNVMTPGCGNAATCMTNTVSNPVITPASISVTKTEPSPGNGTTVTAGQAAPISYNLAVTNSGATASGPVTITDVIPAGTTYVAGSASCGATPNCSASFSPTTVTWMLTSVAPLSTGNLTFQVTVDAGDANGSTISNTASFTNVNTPGCGVATCMTNTVSNPVVTPASVAVVKSEPTPGAGVTVTAGQAAPITYQLAVANSGGTASGAVTVTDAIPAGTTYVAGSASCGATPNCSASFAPTTVTWTLTSVAPLSTGNLTFQVTVNAGDANGSTISNQGSFTNVNTPGCGGPTCMTNTVTNPVTVVPVISVVKSEPTPGAGVTVTAGQAAPITYNLAVTNSGGTPSGAVTVTDAIPAGTTYVAGSASCGATPNCSASFAPTTVTWTLTSVAPLSTGNLTFQVTVNAGDANGSTISNQASFTNVNTPGCGGATCTTNAVTNPVITPASIAVVKSEPTPGAGMTVTAGQAAPITYNLAVSNTGGTASGTVTVTDAIPAGTTYVAGSASCGATPNCSASFAPTTVTWTLTSVAALSTNNLTFQVTVDAGDANGSTISNQASFTNVNTPGCGGATCTTNAVTNPVITPASIAVVKSEPTPGAGTTVTAGQVAPITYNLAVTNSGGTASGTVTVTDAIPAGTTYVAASATCGATPNCTPSFAPTTVTWTLTSVAALSSGTLSFQVTVDLADADGSTISNQASFTNVNTAGCGNAPTCTTNTITNPVVIPPPVVIPQSFSGAVGNTTFGVGTNPAQPSVIISGNLLTGDSDPTGHTLTVTAGTFTTTQGGSVVVNSDGTFTYNPPVNFTGVDTFTYTVSNGFHSASNNVTITVANKVWYVNSALGTNGTGTSISPFNVLSSVHGPGAPTGVGDYIFLFGSATNYTGGIILKANQTLVGQSVGLVVATHTIVTASGANPTVTNTAANPAITLAENDTVSGINVNATSGTGVSASAVNATTITSSNIASTNGDGLNVTGGNGAFSVGAPITTSGGHSVSIQNRTGGTVTLSGAVNDTGTGIFLNANTGATINFTGGVTASTGANPAFTATGGGTVSVTGANNTLTATTGTALNVANTTIGASGLTFKSISSNGATSGIVLNTTGSSGGLTVAGTGSAGSGGTIQNSTNSGILATSTSNLHLSWMTILNNGNAVTEDGIRMVNVFGTGELTSSTVTGSFEDNVYLSNSSGTLTSFAIQGPSCVIGNNNTTSGNTGISVLATLTSTMTVTITNCAFSGNRTDTIHTDTADSSVLHTTITNNVITAGTGGANQGNIGIDVSSALTSTLTYDVENNKIGTDGVTNAPLMNHGINIFSANNSTVTGKVIGNTIRNAGSGFSGFGIRIFQQDSSVLNARVSGNTVSNVGLDFGIDATDNGSGVGASTGKLNVAVVNNNVSVLSAAINAIRVRGRRDTTTCTSITGNTATTNGGGNALSMSQANTAVYNFEIVPPPPLGALTDAQAAAEAASLNPAAVGTEAFSASGTGITGVAVGSCTSIPS